MVAEPDVDDRARTPFPAIVGQGELKRALLTVAANEDLDGLLIAGEKGTAKSTAVRALVDLLPPQRAVADCPYGCPPDDPASQCATCRSRREAGENLSVETRSVPLVTLPLGATRDRVVGTLSVADALDGEAEFDPGLLARANRGVLYVDEVNLLDDHLVDVILDAAASGENTVERDGVSVTHPADFTLVGTMNPEEGDLRPQLRDRFALQATVTGSDDVDERVEIIDRALERSADPDTFAGRYAADVDRLRDRLQTARGAVERVDLPREWKIAIAELCRDAGVDGHRGDIATARTARTLAALDGRGKVIEGDVREAAHFALPHRLRSRPFEDAPSLDDVLDDRFDDDVDQGADPTEGDRGDESTDGEIDDDSIADSDANGERRADADGGPDAESDDTGRSEGQGDPADGPAESDVGDGSRGADGHGDGDASERTEGGDAEGAGGGTASTGGSGRTSAGGPNADADGTESTGDAPADDSDGEEEATPLVPGQRRAPSTVASAGDGVAPDLGDPASLGDGPGPDTETGGARVGTVVEGDRGVRVRSEPAGSSDSVDAAASVRAAVARGSDRIEREDLRRSVRAETPSATVVFVVDASASMRPAMRAAKGVVLDVLRESYERRDAVAFVAFAGEDAEVLLPPTDSVTLAARHLKELPAGDRTPLPAGLDAAREVLGRDDPDAAVVVLVTDGKATVGDGSPTAATRRAARALARTGASVLVVDAGDGDRAGLSELVAGETGGEIVDLAALTPDRIRSAVEPFEDDGR